MHTLYSKVEFAVGFALLAVISGLVFVAAVMRFLGSPIIWSVDMAQLLFIWLCFIGATRAMRQKSHLGVDYLVRLFPYRARLRVETLLTLLFIAFLLTLAVVGYDLTMLNWERVFGDSGLSYAWVTIAVPVGAVLLSLTLFFNLVEAWRSSDRLVYTRTTDSEGTDALPPAGMN